MRKEALKTLMGTLMIATAASAEQPIQFVGSGGISIRPSTTVYIPNEQSFVETYSLVGVERWVGDYYNLEGDRINRLVATRVPVRMGFKLFRKSFDLGVGSRLSKVNSKVYYANPDVTLKINFIRSDYFDLLFYSQVLFPVKAENLDPTTHAEGGLLESDLIRAVDKTIITGLNPKVEANLLGLNLFVAGDARIIKYSKSHQYPTREGRPDLDDRVNRYAHKWTAGANLTLGFFSLEASGAYDTRHVPNNYYNTCNSKWEYRYQIERVSYTKIKAALNLGASTSISAESYYIRNGFFSEDRIDTEMRFKNIISINVNM